MLPKRTRTILVITGLFITHTLTAQVTNFKLRDFKYRTPGFKALGLSLNSSLSTGQGPYGGSGPFQGSKVSNNKLGLSPAVNFAWQYSTDKQQLSLQINEGLNYNSLKRVDSIKKKGSTYQSIANVDFLMRHFINRYFVEWGFTGLFAPSKDNTSSLGGFDIKTKYYNAGLTLGGGMGRLEYVSNAQMALYILEDLKKAGKIKNTVSKETAAAFAHFITQIYNKRIFDFRKRRMYEIEKIDSFLVASKMLASNDTKTFNIISDNWAFAVQPPAIDAAYIYSADPLAYIYVTDPFTSKISNNLSDRYNIDGNLNQPGRYSGRQIYFRAMPSLTYNADKSISADTIIHLPKYINNKNLKFIIGYQERKPLNLKWQFDKFASVAYDNINIGNPVTTDKIKLSTASAIAGVAIGYYPNSRTMVSGVFQLNGYKNFIKAAPKEKIVLGSRIAVNADYFISYNSRISCSLSAGHYGLNTSIIGNKFTLLFNAGYKLYLF
jgi:hypothetical protein